MSINSFEIFTKMKFILQTTVSSFMKWNKSSFKLHGLEVIRCWLIFWWILRNTKARLTKYESFNYFIHQASFMIWQYATFIALSNNLSAIIRIEHYNVERYNCIKLNLNHTIQLIFWIFHPFKFLHDLFPNHEILIVEK